LLFKIFGSFWRSLSGKKTTIGFIETPPARIEVSLSRRGTAPVLACANDVIASDTYDLGTLTFGDGCIVPGGPTQEIAVRAGDVLYLTYSIHPNFNRWEKPHVKISYTHVDNDPGFNLFKKGDPKGITNALLCRWEDANNPGQSSECLLGRQTRYDFDLEIGAAESDPSNTIVLSAGTDRVFHGQFEIPADLTSDYQVFFDVIGQKRPVGTAGLPTVVTSLAPASALPLMFRQDVSEACRAVAGICLVNIKIDRMENCQLPQADCDFFFTDINTPYELAARITVYHKVSTAPLLPVRNISGRLSLLRWHVPPHVRSVLTEQVVAPQPSQVAYRPKPGFDNTVVFYLPIGVGEPDIEYDRVNNGEFPNPDVNLTENAPDKNKIDFKDILDEEQENIKLVRIRQTLDSCAFADELGLFLENHFSSYGPPYADDYIGYWRSKIQVYKPECDRVKAEFNAKGFPDGFRPEVARGNSLGLSKILSNLSYADQITSAETLLERVLANLGLGSELLADNPRLTRRGYRLPAKINPLDCKVLSSGEPVDSRIGAPESKCEYRLLSNFAMEELAADNRAILSRFANSAERAFKVELTATINGDPVAFLELTGEETGNEDCVPSTKKTCLGNYGTFETPANEYPRPTPGGGRHGDLFERITTNKRPGRAVAFSNSLMTTDNNVNARCPRVYPHYEDLGEMERKQDWAGRTRHRLAKLIVQLIELTHTDPTGRIDGVRAQYA
jgi:hypothetical protein